MTVSYIKWLQPSSLVVFNDDMKGECLVFDEDRSPINTGLLDSDGDPIYKTHIKEPIGFKVAQAEG